MENNLKENEDNIRNSKEKENDKINIEKENIINDSQNMINQMDENCISMGQSMMNMDMNINQGNKMNMNMNMHQVGNNNFLIEQMESMMKNYQNHNQISDKEKISDERNQGIVVQFRYSSLDIGNPPLNILCLPDEKVSDIIQKFRAKTGNKDPKKIYIQCKSFKSWSYCC